MGDIPQPGSRAPPPNRPLPPVTAPSLGRSASGSFTGGQPPMTNPQYGVTALPNYAQLPDYNNLPPSRPLPPQHAPPPPTSQPSRGYPAPSHQQPSGYQYGQPAPYNGQPQYSEYSGFQPPVGQPQHQPPSQQYNTVLQPTPASDTSARQRVLVNISEAEIKSFASMFCLDYDDVAEIARTEKGDRDRMIDKLERLKTRKDQEKALFDSRNRIPSSRTSAPSSVAPSTTGSFGGGAAAAPPPSSNRPAGGGGDANGRPPALPTPELQYNSEDVARKVYDILGGSATWAAVVIQLNLRQGSAQAAIADLLDNPTPAENQWTSPTTERKNHSNNDSFAQTSSFAGSNPAAKPATVPVPMSRPQSSVPSVPPPSAPTSAPPAPVVTYPSSDGYHSPPAANRVSYDEAKAASTPLPRTPDNNRMVMGATISPPSNAMLPTTPEESPQQQEQQQSPAHVPPQALMPVQTAPPPPPKGLPPPPAGKLPPPPLAKAPPPAPKVSAPANAPAEDDAAVAPEAGPSKAPAPPPGKAPPPPMGKAPPPPPGKGPPGGPPPPPPGKGAPPPPLGKGPPPPPPPGGPKAPPPPGKAAAAPAAGAAALNGDGSKTKPLYWQKLSEDHIGEDSIWAKMKADGEDGVAAPDQSVFDAAERERMTQAFAKKVVLNPTDAKGATKAGAAPESEKVLDSNREKNVGIVLQFLKLPALTLKQAIETYDEITVNEDMLIGLISICPTAEDEKVIRPLLTRCLAGCTTPEEKRETTLKLLGDTARFSPPTRFFMMAVNMDVFQMRVSCWLTKMQFRRSCDDLMIRLDILQRGALCVTESRSFPAILKLILAMGNLLNQGTNFQDAKAFRIADLSKLSALKTSDNNQTMLQYLVGVVKQKNPDWLNFPLEFAPIHQATTFEISQMVAEMKELKSKVTACQSLLRKKAEDAAIANTMGPFVEAAEQDLSRLATLSESTTAALNKIVPYLGEDPKKMSPTEAMKLLSAFVKEFDAASKALLAKEKKPAGVPTYAATQQHQQPVADNRPSTAPVRMNAAASPTQLVAPPPPARADALRRFEDEL